MLNGREIIIQPSLLEFGQDVHIPHPAYLIAVAAGETGLAVHEVIFELSLEDLPISEHKLTSA